MLKKVFKWRRKSRLDLLLAARKLKQLKIQEEIKRNQFKDLEKEYSKQLFSKGRAGEISSLPEEVVYIVYDNDSELDKINRRILKSKIIHAELNHMMNMLSTKFKTLAFLKSVIDFKVLSKRGNLGKKPRRAAANKGLKRFWW